MSVDLFKNRRLIIATKHLKEKVIAPILEAKLGVNCFVDQEFDTDFLGTFTGEIERTDDPITTVRNKCLSAMKKNNCDLGIASEGSFGPHPTVFFSRANEEILILIDLKNNLEIIVKELSTKTNFDGKIIRSESELRHFAKDVDFPSHGLILRDAEKSNQKIIKGINNWETLISEYNWMVNHFQSVYVETDMRALFNPTRMKNIEIAAEKLVEKVLNACPNCQTPGFSIVSAQKGLPCEICHLPTESTLYYVYSCQKCNHQEKQYYPRNIEVEDPMYCHFCNP